MFKKNSKDTTAGYFGKLPEFNDFIKFNSGLPEILFVDKWIQDGLANAKLKIKNAWKEKYETLLPTNFYIPFQSSGRATAGVMYSSCDKSGREFPMVGFSVIPFKNLSDFAFIPAVLREIPLMLDHHLRNEENLNDLNSSFRNFIPEIKNEAAFSRGFQNYLNSTSIGSFSARTGIDASTISTANLSYSESSFIKISFNSDSDNFAFDCAFFIKQLNQKMNLSPEHSSVFWNKSDDSRFNIAIIPFKLKSINFLDLISPDYNDVRIINIDSSGEEVPHADQGDLKSDTSLGSIL